MAIEKKWVQALQIVHADFARWCDELPKGHSLTYWCLKSGKIDIEKYFNWARDHYQLTSLNSEFFREPADSEFFRLIASVANWSAEMIPITQWDGTIFIACVEPDLDLKWSFPVRYMLARPQDLELYWAQLQNALKAPAAPVVEATVAVAAPPPPVPETVAAPPPVLVMADPPAPEAPTVASENEPFALLAEDAVTPDESHAEAADGEQIPEGAPPATEEETEAPNGFDIDVDINNNSPREFNFDSLLADLDKPKASKPEDAPHGMSAPAPAPASKPAAKPTAPPTPMTVKPLAAPAAVAAKKPLTPPPATATVLTPATPTITLATSSEVKATGNEPIADFTSASKQAVLITAASFDSPTINEANDLNGVAQWAFKELHQKFKSSLFLRVNKNVLHVLACDPYWPAAKGPAPAVDLNQASFLRIVFRTKLPYHGYLVNSVVNDAFFAAYGITTLPEHVTAIPLIIENQIFGIFVSIGDSTASTEDTLHTAERIVSRVADKVAAKKMAA